MNTNQDFSLPQAPMEPRSDLRMMLRNHVVRRSLACMHEADLRRKSVIKSGHLDAYKQSIRDWVAKAHGNLPVGPNADPPQAVLVSSHRKEGYRIENILFDSFPGWEVNATVYVPLGFRPPYRTIVVPVGHSGKQFQNYQLPCQYFARSGFLTITFDPPGQAGEKQAGNDHFRDGVRSYLVGESSNRYFVADALRCIDYLETREDADLRPGVAMTGVSGGGTTTIFSGVLDPRITVTGPSCCLSPLEDLAIRQCYSSCPETRMWRRYADGIDYVDLIGATAPKPTLIMAGKGDEVFRIEDTTVLADTARNLYRVGGCEERFGFFADNSGHAYTLTQAKRFVDFLGCWFGVEGKSEKPEGPELLFESFSMNPDSELQCRPSQEVNMKTLSWERARVLQVERTERKDDLGQLAAEFCQWTPDYSKQVRSEIGPPFRAWVHDMHQVRLVTEGDIELQGSLLMPVGRSHAPVVLHFDDQGRNRLLEAGGLLSRVIRFADRDNPSFTCFSVDLRGWGDTRPAMLPFEIPSWGSTERFFAYSTVSLGDSTMQMRVRDGLTALAFLRIHLKTRDCPVILSGCSLGGIVAAHVAAIDREAAGVVIWDSLRAFEDLLRADDSLWSPNVFVPGVLEHYDIPELLASVSSPVHWINPLDAMKERFDDSVLKSLAEAIGNEAQVSNGDEELISETLLGLLDAVDRE